MVMEHSMGQAIHPMVQEASLEEAFRADLVDSVGLGEAQVELDSMLRVSLRSFWEVDVLEEVPLSQEKM